MSLFLTIGRSPMKWERNALFGRGALAVVAAAAATLGASQGDLLDAAAYAALWTTVAWAAFRQPSVLLIATPASAVLGLLHGSWGACTTGTFLGVVAYWALALPGASLRKRLSRHFFSEIIGEEFSKPILIFLLGFPFMLAAILGGASAGYLIAGDAGAGVGAIAGILLGIAGGMRYFDRVHEKLAPWQLIVLAAMAATMSLIWDSIPGGLVMALILYTALGIGLILWSRPGR
jgi:hypothetical protein